MNLPSPNRHKNASILVAEDESIVRADVEDYLRSLGYRISASVASGEEAKRQATKLGPDLVLMDILLGGKIDGIDAGKYIQKKLGIPVVFVTAHGDEHTLERAKLTAPFGYVLKPFNDRELRTAIEIAMFRHRTEEELRRLQVSLKNILESLEEGVVVTDKFGFITFMNERAAALTGWRTQRAIGKTSGEVVRLVDPATRAAVAPSLAGESGNGRSQSALLLGNRKSENLVQARLSAMTDDSGDVTGAILKLRPEANEGAERSTQAARSPGAAGDCGPASVIARRDAI